MSLTFKLLSLAVRTAAKPIGNYIKRQAKEHEGFRRFAIHQAQRVHRIDMRMRLGILHDAEAQQRMHEREQKAAEEKKKKSDAPTVRTEEEQKKYDEQKARDGKAESEGRKKDEKPPKVKIRPLSDARAIELGANFFSEAFIFGVAVSLLLLENYRSRTKESSRRDEVAERLADLEAQLESVRKEQHLPELEALNEKIRRSREEKSKLSWYNPASWWTKTDPQLPDGDEGISGEVEGPGSKPIPGNVPGASPAKATKPATSPESRDIGATKNGQAASAAPAAEPIRMDTVKATKQER